MEETQVGRSVARVDALEKATGQAQYLDDVVQPGMLYARLLRSKCARAKIIRVDASLARALPGVKAVITAEDLPDTRYGPVIKDTPVLARDEVRYIGEPLAAVAAIDDETARRALGFILVDYQELPPILDVEEAIKPDATLVHEHGDKYLCVFPARKTGNVCSQTTFTTGDVNQGFAEADYVFEDFFSTQEVYQAALEPHGAVARRDGNGKVTVWTTTQSVFGVQATIAESLLIPTSMIRVIGTRVGGAFGGKVEAIVEPVCVALARATGRPVKLVLTLQEEMSATRPRHPARIDIKTGVKKDGTLVARNVRILLDTGAYADNGPGIAAYAAMCACGPYRIPNIFAESNCVLTNKTPSGAYRGFGGPQVTFASESQLDMIADKLGVDRLEIRLKNALENGDTNVFGQTLSSVGIKECIRRVGEAVGWGKTRSSPYRGVGIACMHQISGVMNACANVRLNQDGTITLQAAASELGQGCDTILCQIVGEELGVPMECVNIVTTDTDAAPYNWATCASRTTYTMGAAAKLAASEAKKQIFQLAAATLEASPADLVSAGGAVFVKGSPEKKLSFFDLGLVTHFVTGKPITGSSAVMIAEPGNAPGCVEGFPFPPLTAWVFGAQAVEVEVDPRTGNVRVLRAVAAHDVGKAINPRNVEGQIEGGFVQGVGYALYEEIVREKGAVVNRTFADYRSPTAMDVPLITPIIVEETDPTGPFGAKGVGEPGTVPTAAAIANAICDAVGVRIKDLPISSARVAKGVKNKA